MPYDDPDPGDPQMLVGVLAPARPGTMQEMAEVFAEEFARMGYSGPRILALFDDPFFAGPHAALRALGEPAIREIIVQAVTRWPAVRIVDAPSRREG
jgi:hypothetical protein